MKTLPVLRNAVVVARYCFIGLLFAVFAPAAVLFAAQDEGVPAVIFDSAPKSPRTVLPPLPPERRYSIRRVRLPEGKKWIAFTFDLCESATKPAGFDSRVVDILEKNRVEATFFASGKWMKSHPEETLRLMGNPLFELGGHGWAHENFRLLNRIEAEKLFQRTQAFYEMLRDEMFQRRGGGPGAANMEQIPLLPGVFRFPFGTCNAEVLNMPASHGVAAIQWDVVSGDASRSQTARGITDTVLKQAVPGSIVVFHANGRGHGTAQALPGLIEKFRSRGFEFVTVDKLLGVGTPVVSPECYELRPGDNKRYDKFK